MSENTPHLSQDDFVLAYYGEPGIDAQREHLAACDACRGELERLKSVLDQVMPVELAEPDEDYEARVWDRVAWRLRGERNPVAGRSGMKWLAAAAMLAVAFLGGLLWNRSNTGPVRTGNQPIATATPATAPATAASTQQQRDRILLVVVGDHLDDSERMLVELTNLTAKTDVDVSTERQRAEDLLASNRLYRRTALDRGEDRVATLLDELEPVLMQIAHGPSQMTPDELQRVQKRVETKGLVFKLRVLRADVRATAAPHLKQPNI